MSKTRILGALVLAMGISFGAAMPNSAFATSKTLAELTAEAKSAQKYAAGHSSAEYPGMSKYLQKLINFAEADKIENEAELIKALDEAMMAMPLIYPEMTKTVATSVQALNLSEPVEVAEVTTAEATNMASEPTLATTVALTVVAEDEPTAEDAPAAQDYAESVEAAVDLPNTGETRRAGLGELILAGAAVVLGTIGATVLIVRSRKNIK